MTEVRRTALVPYTPAEIFALVADIPSYPDFLPWCRSAEIISQQDSSVRASIEIAKGAVQKTFVTENENQPDSLIKMQLVEGPFSELEGFWRFDALGDQGCKITLELDFSFSNRILELAVGPVFTKIANTLVDSFQQRAGEVYGRR